MSGQAKLRASFFVLFLAAVLLAAAQGSHAMAAEPVRIGVVQIVEHPSLDIARKGFIDSLGEHGYVEGQNVVYDIQNAQGDLSLARSIADKFVADRVDMILAIATPTAQAAAQATRSIPILITAVTDPVAAGLVESIEHPGTNVTGTSDLNPVAEQLALVKKFKPAARRVGIVYNAGEVNSVVQVDLAREAAQELGLDLVLVTVTSSAEVLQATQTLVGRVDAIYVPGDNTVVSALESVLQVGIQNKLPVIAAEGDSVRRGALATLGIDYYRLGRQTGDMAVRILRGEARPADTPIQYQKELRLVVNRRAAEQMGVSIPAELLASAEVVE